MYDNLYCKVFIDTKLDYDVLFTKISKYINGEKKSFSYVVADWCDMFIQKNKEHNINNYVSNPKDFIYWKYYIDLEPRNIEETQYIKKVVNLYCFLREISIDVIVACDFEDEIKRLMRN